MEDTCLSESDSSLNGVDLLQHVVNNKTAATPVLQSEANNLLFEQDMSLEVKQQQHKRAASVDCTPKNHSEPAWKRLRRLSEEEALPAELHMLAERQVQDGDRLTAVIDAKSNASETSLCSDSNSSRSSFVLAERQTEGRNDFEAVDKDKGNTSEASLSCDEAWPQWSFVSKDNENEVLPEMILFQAIAGHYDGTKFTTPV